MPEKIETLIDNFLALLESRFDKRGHESQHLLCIKHEEEPARNPGRRSPNLFVTSSIKNKTPTTTMEHLLRRRMSVFKEPTQKKTETEKKFPSASVGTA